MSSTATKYFIQPAELLAAGYRNFNDRTKLASLGTAYQGSYQKRFDDSVGKRYFITFNHARLSNGRDSWESMTAAAQFTRGDSVCNIDLLNRNESLAETEAFFAEMWEKMRFEHYEAFDED
ncbi:MAG: hypothetical protein AB7F99_19970 [Vicinamibacterales bacterium]